MNKGAIIPGMGYDDQLSGTGNSSVIPEARIWKFQVMDINYKCGQAYGTVKARKKRGKDTSRAEAEFFDFVCQLHAQLRGAASKPKRKRRYVELMTFETYIDNDKNIKHSYVVKIWRILTDLITELKITDAEIIEHDVNTLFARD